MSINRVALKTAKEIEILKEGGQILSSILKALAGVIRPGISGEEVDNKASELAKKHGAVCSFYDYKGFPAHLCLSTNDEIVHGFPFGKTIQEGDLVSLDMGIKYKNLFTDSSITLVVPHKDPRKNQLPDYRKKIKIAKITLRCLKATLPYCRIGCRLGDIGLAVQSRAEKKGYSVVKKLVGHGVGYAVHEEPFVPNFGQRGKGMRLRPGMIIAIEPMINEGTDDIILDQATGWTYKTRDGKLSAHFEWTVAITSHKPIILTPLNWVAFKD